mgnify:CR=1 FL=1
MAPKSRQLARAVGRRQRGVELARDQVQARRQRRADALAHQVGLAGGVAAAHLRDDALEPRRGGVPAAPPLAKVQALHARRAEQQQVAVLYRQQVTPQDSIFARVATLEYLCHRSIVVPCCNVLNVIAAIKFGLHGMLFVYDAACLSCFTCAMAYIEALDPKIIGIHFVVGCEHRYDGFGSFLSTRALQ